MICLSSAGDLTRFQVERVLQSSHYSPSGGLPRTETGEQGEHNAGSHLKGTIGHAQYEPPQVQKPNRKRSQPAGSDPSRNPTLPVGIRNVQTPDLHAPTLRTHHEDGRKVKQGQDPKRPETRSTSLTSADSSRRRPKSETRSGSEMTARTS